MDHVEEILWQASVDWVVEVYLLLSIIHLPDSQTKRSAS